MRIGRGESQSAQWTSAPRMQNEEPVRNPVVPEVDDKPEQMRLAAFHGPAAALLIEHAAWHQSYLCGGAADHSAVRFSDSAAAATSRG